MRGVFLLVLGLPGLFLARPVAAQDQAEVTLLSRYVQQAQVLAACGIRSHGWGRMLEAAATERLMAQRGAMPEGEMQTLVENARESGAEVARQRDLRACTSMRGSAFPRGGDLLVAHRLRLEANCPCAAQGCNEPSLEALRAPPVDTPVPRVPRNPTVGNVDCGG